MANNLRYLLEHFCLDGQKIDISSQLDEENANNIEKINTQTVPSINARIDDIKNTDIPNINSRIDNIKNTDIHGINQKINTINNTTIPSIQASVTAVDEKADRINASVAKNTRDIGTLSDNVTMQGNTINSIETEKIPSVENNIEVVARETLRISTAHEHDMNGINESLSALHVETSSNTTNIENLTTSINGLTTKVNTNTDSINGLTTKVDTNTDSINTINNTSIPHLQSEIDNLSGGGTGSVGELREKVEKNTSDISALSDKVETNTAGISTLSGKVDTNTDSINTINNTSIPHLQSEIDNLSGGGTGSVGELREKVEKNTSDISALSDKVETNTAGISTLSGKVDTNTANISTLSGKVDSNTTAINGINETSIPALQNEIINVKKWEKILDEYHTPKGMIVNAFVNRQLCLIQLSATLSTPQTLEDGEIMEIIPNYSTFSPRYIVSSSVYVDGYVSSDVHGIFSSHFNNELTISFKMSSYKYPAVLRASVLYSYYK